MAGHYLGLGFLLLFLHACSSAPQKRDETQQVAGAASTSSESVSKEEYLALKQKYDALVQKTSGESVGGSETVDVFASVDKEMGNNPPASSAANPPEDKGMPTETALDKLREAYELINAKDVKGAAALLHPLKQHPIKAIQVQAFFLEAETFFAQQEWDLALQNYELIINHYGHSSLSIDALNRLISCTDQLKLAEKKAHYEELYRNLMLPSL